MSLLDSRSVACTSHALVAVGFCACTSHAFVGFCVAVAASAVAGSGLRLVGVAPSGSCHADESPKLAASKNWSPDHGIFCAGIWCVFFFFRSWHDHRQIITVMFCKKLQQCPQSYRTTPSQSNNAQISKQAVRTVKGDQRCHRPSRVPALGFAILLQAPVSHHSLPDENFEWHRLLGVYKSLFCQRQKGLWCPRTKKKIGAALARSG